MFFLIMIFCVNCYPFSKDVLEFKILGLQNELSNIIITQIKLKSKFIAVVNDNNIKNFYSCIPSEIIKILELNGYFGSTVSLCSLTCKNNRWIGIFKVILKKRLKIESIDLKILGIGSKDFNIINKLQYFPLRKCDIFSIDIYNKAKQFLFDLADSNGYPNAYLVSKKVLINLNKDTVKIILHLETGSKFYFGETTFNSVCFEERFLKKFLTYKYGNLYSIAKLQDLYLALNKSNFFENIIITPQIKMTDKYVPIEVVLIPYKSQQYNIGAGYSTDIGIRGLVNLEKKYLTVDGHSMKGILGWSRNYSNFNFHYLIPGEKPACDLYSLDLIGQFWNIVDMDMKNWFFCVGTSYSTMLMNWNQVIKCMLHYERDIFTKYNLSNYEYVLENKNKYCLLIHNINLHKSTMDYSLKSTIGYRYSFDVNMRTAINNFLQFRAYIKYVFFLNNIDIITNIILGWTAANDTNNVLWSLQSYFDGMQNIRSFNHHNLDLGYNLAIGSIELRYRIIKNWYLTSFWDMGKIYNRSVDHKQNIGIGIILRTVLGSLELTYAKSIGESPSSSGIQFGLSPIL